MQAAKTRKIFDNRYEILSIVGRSKHSVVYHARHVMAPATEVALKVLLSRKDMQSNADRLRKEALAMVSCRHRYVIRLDDFHSVGDLCYLSMEYAPESDLRKYVERSGGILPPTQAQLFMSQIAEALAFCHRAGITHRDIKQDNFLVVNDREVRLADFSVALLPGDESSLEELQRGVGSMDYMAPEILEGKSSEQRSDLYSLGVAFYELLSGKHPFSSAPLLQQLEIRKDGAFAPLSQIAPHVPKPLADIVMKCLRYNVDDRPASAQEIIDQLAQGLPKMRSKPGSEGSSPATSAVQKAPTPVEGTTTTPAALIEAPKVEAPAAQPPVATADAEKTSPHKPLATGPIPTKFSKETGSSQRPPSEFLLADKPAAALKSPAAPATASALSPAELAASAAQTAAIPFAGAASSSKSTVQIQDEPKQTTEREQAQKARPTPQTGNRRARTSAPPESPEELMRQRSSRAKTEHIDQNLVAQIRAHREKIAPEKASGAEPPSATPTTTSTSKRASQPPLPVQRRRTMLMASIAGGLAGFVMLLALWLGGSTELPTPEQGTSAAAAATTAEQPPPSEATTPLAFPDLPGGLYPGSINGILPNQELPLALISLPESKRLIVVIGLEGWSPAVIDLSTRSEKDIAEGAPIRLASNGFVLELSGSVVDDSVQGTFFNRVTREEGTWVVSRNRK